MRRYIVRGVAAVGFIGVGFLGAWALLSNPEMSPDKAAPVMAEGTVKLKMQSAWNANLPVLGESAKYFADQVGAMSDGAVDVQFFDSGKLVPTLQIFDAVSAGKVDAGFAWPGYWVGKVPAAAVFGGTPFGPDPAELLAWLYHGGGLEMWRELYAVHNMVPTPCGVIPPEPGGWYRNEINTLEDLKGLKMRFAGLGGETLKKLGVSVTVLGAGDIFPNLERGVIDATEFSVPAIDKALGFYKAAKFYYFPGFHQPSSVTELMVYKPTWDAMTQNQKAAIEGACQATSAWMLGKSIGDQAAAIDFLKEQGVNIRQWGPEFMPAFRKAADEVYADFSEQNPDFQKVWESLQAFRAKNAEYQGMAYIR